MVGGSPIGRSHMVFGIDFETIIATKESIGETVAIKRNIGKYTCGHHKNYQRVAHVLYIVGIIFGTYRNIRKYGTKSLLGSEGV